MRRVLVGVLLLSALSACSESPLQVSDKTPSPTVPAPQFTRIGDGATWYYEATVRWSSYPGVSVGDRIQGTVDFQITTADVWPSMPYSDGRFGQITFNYTVNGQPRSSTGTGWIVAVVYPDAWGPIITIRTGYPVETELQVYNEANNLDFPLTPPALNPVYNEFLVQDYSTSPRNYYRAQFTVLRGVTVRPADTTPPVITPVITGVLGEDGWYRSNVNITWNVSDPESAITYNTCTPVTINYDTNGVTRYCAATSTGGTSYSSVMVKRDATPPALQFLGNAGSYFVDQYIAISCRYEDALSGVASRSCPNVYAPAYTFAPGENTLNASAADYAGNTAVASATFKIVVDENSLGSLIYQMVPQRGVANSLRVKLQQKDATAFLNEVRAQAGKLISEDNARILSTLAIALLGE